MRSFRTQIERYRIGVGALTSKGGEIRVFKSRRDVLSRETLPGDQGGVMSWQSRKR